MLVLTTVLAFVACGPTARSERPPGPGPLTPELAAARIVESKRFAEPIHIELPSIGRGPTIDAFAAAGLIEPGKSARQPFSVTAAGHAAGFEPMTFQTDIPVFRVPIAARQLIAVLEIKTTDTGRDAVATFSYRQIPSAVGQHLTRGGSRVHGLDENEMRRGRAVLSSTDAGWKVVSVEL